MWRVTNVCGFDMPELVLALTYVQYCYVICSFINTAANNYWLSKSATGWNFVSYRYFCRASDCFQIFWAQSLNIEKQKQKTSTWVSVSNKSTSRAHKIEWCLSTINWHVTRLVLKFYLQQWVEPNSVVEIFFFSKELGLSLQVFHNLIFFFLNIVFFLQKTI